MLIFENTGITVRGEGGVLTLLYFFILLGFAGAGRERFVKKKWY